MCVRFLKLSFTNAFRYNTTHNLESEAAKLWMVRKKTTHLSFNVG